MCIGYSNDHTWEYIDDLPVHVFLVDDVRVTETVIGHSFSLLFM